MVQDNTRENKFKIQKTRQWSIMQQSYRKEKSLTCQERA